MSSVWLLPLFLLSLAIPSSNADNFDNPQTWPNRTLMVHLFEWKYSDIAKECAFLAKYNYGAVQISPPQEHIVVEEDSDLPWYIR